MRWLTDVLYLAVLLLTAPIWFTRMALRGRLRTDWAGRLGRAPSLAPADGTRVLLHAVSVGEVNAIRTLVSLLEVQDGVEVVVATTTDTGFARATSLFGDRHQVVRYPLDLSWSVARFLRSVKPDLVGLVELEVWPNFVASCVRRGIPVAVINGRLSERSFRRYRLVRAVLRPSFRRLTRAWVQTRDYAARFEAMGVVPDRVDVVGSLKWDNTGVITGDPEGLAQAMGIDRTRLLVVAGSTAPEEHQLLHDGVGTGVQLMCAPRRPEWFDDAAQVLQGCTRRSTGERGSNPDRYLLDTIGELSQAYALADVVVVGRSFGSRHGSDVSEPAGLGKPVIIGPASSDFEEMVVALQDAGGLIQCSREELPGVLSDLLNDEQRRARMASDGRGEIGRRQGASERTLAGLLDLVGLVGEGQRKSTR